MGYYFIKLFRQHGELVAPYCSFVETLIGYKKREQKRSVLKRKLIELHESFSEIYPFDKDSYKNDEVGFAQFFYKTVLKLDSLINPRTTGLANSLDAVRKVGLESGRGKTTIHQNELVSLFNRQFRQLTYIHNSHFSVIKKKIDFQKYSELHWLIYLHYMKFMVELKRCQECKNDDEQVLSTFFQKSLIKIESYSEKRLRDETISICLDFIDYFAPCLKKEREERLEEVRREMIYKVKIYNANPIAVKDGNKGRKGCICGISPFMVLSFIGVIIFFFLLPARFNLLGEGAYYISRQIVPLYIAPIDRAIPIPLDYSFSRIDKQGRVELQRGATFYSGERITINYNLPYPCYFTIFSIDSGGIHYIPGFPEDMEPLKLDGRFAGAVTFSLDKAAGLELYYLLVSYEPFSFEEDVRVKLSAVFPSGTTEGKSLANYPLELKEGISQYSIYFNHLEAER